MGCRLTLGEKFENDSWPELLKTHFSYLILHDMEHLETGVSSEEEGRKIGSQLAHRRIEILSFQVLTRAEPLLVPAFGITSPGTWVHSLGFGKQITFFLAMEFGRALWYADEGRSKRRLWNLRSRHLRNTFCFRNSALSSFQTLSSFPKLSGCVPVVSSEPQGFLSLGQVANRSPLT